MYQEILQWWFDDLEPSQWWRQSDELDSYIIANFTEVHSQARSCELFEWRDTAQGRLAEIIVLDQFSRNMFRGTAQSFAYDSIALALAQEAISVGADKELNPTQRTFLYLPYMHSESLAIHEVATGLYKQNGLEDNYEFEIKHKVIIEKFGRYPHRNEILGRESTPEEIKFLTQPNSSF